MQYPQTKSPGSGDQLGGPYGLSIQNIRDVAVLFAQQPCLFWQMCRVGSGKNALVGVF